MSVLFGRCLNLRVVPALCLALCSLGFLGMGCATSGSAWAPDAQRSVDLPSTAEALLALADAEVAVKPRTPHTVDRALAALEALESLSTSPDFQTHWRIARASFYLSDLVSDDHLQTRYAALGVKHAEKAVEARGDAVEGHYYLALNIAKQVEAEGEVKGLQRMLDIAKRAAELDAGFDQAGPLRLMGKVYMVAPEWPTSVGDRDESVEVLKRAVSLHSTPLNRLFLGQAFFHIDAFKKAIPHVRSALKAGRKSGLEERWLDEARSYLMRMGASE